MKQETSFKYRLEMERELKKAQIEKFEKETAITGSLNCDACPYVVYGQYGERRCYWETYNDCMNGIEE